MNRGKQEEQRMYGLNRAVSKLKDIYTIIFYI